MHTAKGRNCLLWLLLKVSPSWGDGDPGFGTEWLWARLFLPPFPLQFPSLPGTQMGVWWRMHRLIEPSVQPADLGVPTPTSQRRKWRQRDRKLLAQDIPASGEFSPHLWLPRLPVQTPSPVSRQLILPAHVSPGPGHVQPCLLRNSPC